jgi:hypothetical protein
VTFTKNLGDLLLGIFLILAGLGYFGVAIPFADFLLGALGLVAGVLKLIGK